MNAVRVETTVESDGELHLTELPCRRGDKIEAIVLILEPASRNMADAKREKRAPRPLSNSWHSPGPPRSDRPALIPRAMSFMNVLDTNIWIYSHDTRDPHKQARAQQLIATVRPLALPWQVGCEFIAACRKLAPAGFTETQAWSALIAMARLGRYHSPSRPRFVARNASPPGALFPILLGRPLGGRLSA